MKISYDIKKIQFSSKLSWLKVLQEELTILNIEWQMETRVSTCKEIHTSKTRFNRICKMMDSKFAVTIWQVFIYPQLSDYCI